MERFATRRGGGERDSDRLATRLGGGDLVKDLWASLLGGGDADRSVECERVERLYDLSLAYPLGGVRETGLPRFVSRRGDGDRERLEE